MFSHPIQDRRILTAVVSSPNPAKSPTNVPYSFGMAPPTTNDVLTTDCSNIRLVKAPTSDFLSLPREIRDDIFAYLLRAGDLAVLRTSKQVHHEAKERLYIEGFFRYNTGIHAGSYFPNDWMDFPNFHLQIFVGSRDPLPASTCWRLDHLGLLDKTQLKRECVIIFDFSIGDQRPKIGHDNCRLRWVLSKLAFLVIFATVEMMFVPEDFEIWHTEQTERTMRDKWGVLREYLEPVLGPGKLIEGDWFSTLGNFATLWRKSSQNVIHESISEGRAEKW